MSDKATLGEVLDRFNRKERNLLIRDILGHSQAKLKLSDDFRCRLAEKVGFLISPNAWWATDYHFDWIVAALAVYSGGIGLVKLPQTNEIKLPPGIETERFEKIIKGTQEDVDLIIADNDRLILIEVKAYEAWSNQQAASKRRRFGELRAYNKTSNALPTPNLHFLLMSPLPPQHLKDEEGQAPLRHIVLKIDQSLSSYRVERCEENKKPSKDGGHWRVVETVASTAPDETDA